MAKKEVFSRKAINFDLLTSELKKIYKSNNPFVYMKGYKEIGRFLVAKGFEHRQWSGYISKEPISHLKATQIVKELNKKLPWLKKCVRRFDVTNIGEPFDLMYVFNGKVMTKLQTREQESRQVERPKRSTQKSILSRTSIKANAKIIADKQHTEHKPTRNNNKSR
ncbi:MAG: VapD family protein [Acutalibacteraceae bacterium]